MSKFAEIVNEYYTKLQALNFSGDIVMVFLSENFKKIFSKTYLDAIQDIDQDGNKILKMSEKQYYKFQQMTGGFTYLPRSLIVTAVSVYDVLLSKLIEEFFEVQKDAIKLIKQDITFDELSTFSSIEDARHHLIWREIDNLLRQSHLEHLRWIESKTNLTKLSSNNKFLKDFIEVTERRNLFVHNDGIVNKYYLKNCQDAGIDTLHLKEMDVLDCNEKYFNKAFDSLTIFGILLGHSIWRKTCPLEIDDANTELFDLIVRIISDKKYDTAITILDYFKTNIKQFDDEAKLLLDLNIAQCYKWQKKQEQCNLILKEKNWMAYSNRYKLAFYVLIDDFDNAAEVIKNLSSSDKLGITSIREWPIFQKAIKNDKIKAACKEKFGEEICQDEEIQMKK